MNSKELRSGNYLQGSSLSIPKMNISHDGVTEISSYGIYLMSIAENISQSHGYEPIPITEGWLRKFGFKDNSYRDYFLYHPIADYAIISISFRYNKTQLSDVTSISVDDHDLNLNFEYVHQLQNLYFSLTGEELTIIPPH